MMTASSQGSWYPSSFHGHFRSKHRNDFVNEYRQQAKPSPPGKFVRRLTSRPTTHQFSNHDNRFSFLNTVTSFQDGLGKKKVESNHKSKFVPDFISWIPHKREISQSGPLESVYRDTFKESDRKASPQILINTIPKPKVIQETGNFTVSKSVPYSGPVDIEDLVSKPVTTYGFVHRHMQPNRQINTNMNTGHVQESPVPTQITPNYINPKVPSIYERPKTALTKLRRARISSAPNLRSSVADCLRWHDADDNKDMVRPQTVTGHLPELSSNGEAQVLNLTGSAPNLTNFQNGSPVTHNTQSAWSSNDYVKTSRVPATQTVEPLGNSNSHADVTPSAVPIEEG